MRRGDADHRCHLPGCSNKCPPRHLFCERHWRLVPRDIRQRVYATVHQRRRGAVDATWAPWWRAQADATASVLTQLVPQRAEAIEAKRQRDHAFAATLESFDAMES